jgi:hypothetical protein
VITDDDQDDGLGVKSRRSFFDSQDNLDETSPDENLLKTGKSKE